MPWQFARALRMQVRLRGDEDGGPQSNGPQHLD